MVKADGDHTGDPELKPHFYQNIRILFLSSYTRNKKIATNCIIVDRFI